jgi:hypothetical protein
MISAISFYLSIGLVVNFCFFVWNWQRFDSVRDIHFGYQMFAFWVALIVFAPFWPLLIIVWYKYDKL